MFSYTHLKLLRDEVPPTRLAPQPTTVSVPTNDVNSIGIL